MKKILLLSTLLTTGSLITGLAHAQQTVPLATNRVERLKTAIIPSEILQNYRVNGCSFLQSPNQSQTFLQCMMELAYPLDVAGSEVDVPLQSASTFRATEEQEKPAVNDQLTERARDGNLTSGGLETASPNDSKVTLKDEVGEPEDIGEFEEECGGGEGEPKALWVGKIDGQGIVGQNWFINESTLTEKNFSRVNSVSDQGKLLALSSGYDDANDHFLTKILATATNETDLSFQDATVLSGDFFLNILSNQQIVGMEIGDEEKGFFSNIKRIQSTDGQVIWNVSMAKLAADNQWKLRNTADIVERANHNLLVYGPVDVPDEKVQSKKINNQSGVLFFDQLNDKQTNEEMDAQFLLCLSEGGQTMGVGMLQQAAHRVIAMPDNTVRFISMIDPDASSKYPQLILRSVDTNCHVSARQSVNLPARPIKEGAEIYVGLESIVPLAGNEMAVFYKQITIQDQPEKQETIVYMLAKIDQNGKVVLDIPVTEVFDDTEGNFLGLNSDIISIPSENQVLITIVNDTILENDKDQEKFLAIPRLYKVKLN